MQLGIRNGRCGGVIRIVRIVRIVGGRQRILRPHTEGTETQRGRLAATERAQREGGEGTERSPSGDEEDTEGAFGERGSG